MNGPVTPVNPRQARRRRPYRGPVLFVIGAALIASLVLDRSSVLEPTQPSTAAAIEAISADPTVPASNAVSTSWYCAEGTSTPTDAPTRPS